MTILEALLDYSPGVKDPETLTEYVRQALSRSITKQYVNDEGKLTVFTLDPKIRKNTVPGRRRRCYSDVINRLVKSIENILASGKLKGAQPIILCSANIRKYIQKDSGKDFLVLCRALKCGNCIKNRPRHQRNGEV